MIVSEIYSFNLYEDTLYNSSYEVHDVIEIGMGGRVVNDKTLPCYRG